MWGQGPRDMGHPLLLSEALGRERDGKGNIWNMNQHPYEMPVLEGGGFSC